MVMGLLIFYKLKLTLTYSRSSRGWNRLLDVKHTSPATLPLAIMAFLHLGPLPSFGYPVTILLHRFTGMDAFFSGTRAAVGSATRAALEALIHLGGGRPGVTGS